MDRFDLAVVGGGPGGLQAALKAALLHKRVVLFDRDRKRSRIFFAPRVANIPGSGEVIRGSQVIKSGYQALSRVNAELGDLVRVRENTEVTGIQRLAEGFELTHTDEEGTERSLADVVILATGVVDRQPWIGPEAYDIGPVLPYANKGLVDYCLLCDGHTVIGKRVVVIGADESAVGIAQTLRDGFDADVTVAACIPCATGEADHEEVDHAKMSERVQEAGIPFLDITIQDIQGLRDDQVILVDQEGKHHTFEKAFLSFGWYEVNNELAVQLGAPTSRAGYLYTDEDCQVLDGKQGEPLGDLYAVGDLRYETWNQIPSAWADAETAVIHAWSQHL
ncbi:MAG: FAD-dependent oxidoreductase [Candidatus Thermoplasmatota archaeon]|nr:FAD-dependent oxidoreductase [Candidatus Thermoplasmatota archaeon]